MKKHPNIDRLAAFIGTQSNADKLEKRLIEYIKENSSKSGQTPRKTA